MCFWQALLAALDQAASHQGARAFPVCRKTVSGVALTKRPHLRAAPSQAFTNKFGGKYSATCHLEVTHLLTEKPSGAKFDFAARNNSIAVVTPAWHTDCMEAGGLLDVAKYTVHAPVAAATPQRAPVAAFSSAIPKLRQIALA